MASTAASSVPVWISPPEAEDPRWAAVKKVANSPGFAKATLLREFLLYIARHELDGHQEEITEQKIGHRVYKRSEVYSPAEDNIVRVSAHQLRVKLHEFYEAEGSSESWIIEIPKGKYVPLFRPRSEPIQSEPGSAAAKISRPIIWFLASAVLAVSALVVWWHVSRVKALPVPPVAPSNLITLVFHSANDPVYVVMSDEALVLMQDMLGRRFSLEEYSNQTYRNLPAPFRNNREAILTWNALTKRQIVNIGDAGVSTRIKESLGRLGSSPVVEIRSAQNMRPRDFLSGNFVLLGDYSSDPWTEMFGESRFNFQFNDDIFHYPRHILNVHPRPGEQAFFEADLVHHLSYARIAYIPNLTNTGQMLLIAGTSMEGTEAAADFCLRADSIPELLRALHLGSESRMPPFEALLMTSSKGGTGISAHVVAARIIGGSAP
jgi:hypothetical protein